MPCCNTREELSIKQGYGPICRPNNVSRHQRDGDGKKLIVLGNQCGPLCLKLLKHAVSYSSAVARKDVRVDANVLRPICNVQNFVPVQLDAPIHHHHKFVYTTKNVY